jgi:hypothetical protein
MATPSHPRIRLLPATRPPVHTPAQRTATSPIASARNIGAPIASAPAIPLLRGATSGPAGAPPALVFFPATGSRAIARPRRAGGR